MQTATLNYQYNPKESFYSDSKSKFQLRHVLATVKTPQKKFKQHQPCNSYLPPIKNTSKRPNSIRIKGSGLTSSKFNDRSLPSFNQPTRLHSRQSNKTDISATRSRSVCITTNLLNNNYFFSIDYSIRNSKICIKISSS